MRQDRATGPAGRRRAVAFRAAPRSTPLASDRSAESDERLSVRINPEQPMLPWEAEEALPSAPVGPRGGRPPKVRHAKDGQPTVRIARFTPILTPRYGTPDPVRWAVRLAEAILEVIAGLRPLPQLERWVSPSALAQLAGEARRRRAGDRPTLYALHLHQDTALAAEVAAVYGWPDRRCAMAFRIDATRRGWVCSALVLPPSNKVLPPDKPPPDKPKPPDG